MSDFASRLRGEIGLRPVAAVARAAGLKQQTVDGYLRGAQPSAEKAFALADALGVNSRWLVTGEGIREPSREFLQEEDYLWVPHYDLFAFEGPTPPPQLERVPLPRGWLATHARTTSGLWVTEMPNDAMPRTAPQGTMIVLKGAGEHLQDRKTYAFLLAGRPLIRTVELRPDGLALVAESPEIEPITPSAEQLEQLLAIGQVVGAHRLQAI